ncbi:dTDP-4-dehydrorhamnose reductase [Janthinobacterium lividum]|uniref:dTDP-4-dehydrorhamnose reductase n=1 Tax=Janthinobacterium lividum TaxID=29581 RepID=UPI00087499CA|nr:dTDP-4-dehydrorhamnose reductase [Janthinobacterium lividum]MCC7715295.1 dTDP-4-dehydrorhamnose reductase [Janthinobacterium lividum]OEZ59628.1 dTDP-4-dehydrorhamnose reductase [Janthinobacterium lividum]WQE28671.1 dTDP-4-dehydrorhamnose reductase [Janthinobacterium lividum]STQ99621.1 dTDP-4-dehydrorhamnose reductase [Janthinobacterium lividum]
MSRILITGKTGQVGYELERSLQGLGEIIAVDRSQMDLADLDQVRDVIRRIKPTLIVNPAAYTAVDKAESEPELAMRINGEAPGVMAEEAKKLGAAMIHYSTDYVFDGSKDGAYVETDPTCPVNVYGSSKLAGEQAIAAAGIPHLILRTSWVYSTHGKNFLLTMLRLAQEREELGIVSDQFGAPTWSRTIADTTAHIVAQSLAAADQQTWWNERSGLYHLTAQGKTSWFGFTEAIMAHPSVVKKPKLKPILAQNYPVPAKRPSNSVLSSQHLIDTFCNLPQWQTALKLCQE